MITSIIWSQPLSRMGRDELRKSCRLIFTWKHIFVHSVCEREREKGRGGESEKGREKRKRDRGRERDTDRQTQTHTEADAESQGGGGRCVWVCVGTYPKVKE